MCQGDNIKTKDSQTKLENDQKSAKHLLEEWIRSHSEILKDPWEESEWEDSSPLTNHPLSIDPTFGRENLYSECIQNKRSDYKMCVQYSCLVLIA